MGTHQRADRATHEPSQEDVSALRVGIPCAEWTKPSKAMPPLHTQVLIALNGCAGGDGDVLDVACYIGKQVEGDVTVDRWIGTGNRLETRQIAGWMEVYTMRDVTQMQKRIVRLEAMLADAALQDA